MFDPLSEINQDIIRDAAESNRPWFLAFLAAAEIQAIRRRKYSGADFEQDDPYTNFIKVALMMGLSVRQVFKYYLAQKLARIMVSDKDYDDERYVDTLLDICNYALLAAGWERRDDDTQAIFDTIKETLAGVTVLDMPFAPDMYEIEG